MIVLGLDTTTYRRLAYLESDWPLLTQYLHQRPDLIAKETFMTNLAETRGKNSQRLMGLLESG